MPGEECGAGHSGQEGEHAPAWRRSWCSGGGGLVLAQDWREEMGAMEGSRGGEESVLTNALATPVLPLDSCDPF